MSEDKQYAPNVVTELGQIYVDAQKLVDARAEIERLTAQVAEGKRLLQALRLRYPGYDGDPYLWVEIDAHLNANPEPKKDGDHD